MKNITDTYLQSEASTGHAVYLGGGSGEGAEPWGKVLIFKGDRQDVWYPHAGSIQHEGHGALMGAPLILPGLTATVTEHSRPQLCTESYTPSLGPPRMLFTAQPPRSQERERHECACARVCRGGRAREGYSTMEKGRGGAGRERRKAEITEASHSTWKC